MCNEDMGNEKELEQYTITTKLPIESIKTGSKSGSRRPSRRVKRKSSRK